MQKTFNQKVKQVVFLILLVLLIGLVFNELKDYFLGILGAITLYVVSREKYFQLVYKYKWRKAWLAMGFVLFYLLLIAVPMYLAGRLITPKIELLLVDPGATINSIKSALAVIQQKAGFNLTSQNTINDILSRISNILPSLFNSTANLLTNIVLMLFLLYYLLYSGTIIEKTFYKNIPLKNENITLLAAETKVTIKSNAIGIPLISLIQGVTAAIGYMIFGIADVALWGFLTGLFSFLPVLGTMIVWIPICVYQYAVGHTGAAIGLALYSAIVTANIDYFARITIMKKLGDVHPVTTLLGIIIGLSLFGFIGLVFGPLMINYILVLCKIYINEYVDVDIHNPIISEANLKTETAGIKKVDLQNS